MNINILINIIVITFFFIIYIINVYFLNRRELKNKKINFIQNIFLLKPLNYHLALILSNAILLSLWISSFVLSILELTKRLNLEIYITFLNSIIIILGLLNLLFLNKNKTI